jgi:hypothetical protein
MSHDNPVDLRFIVRRRCYYHRQLVDAPYKINLVPYIQAKVEERTSKLWVNNFSNRYKHEWRKIAI